MMIPAKLYAVLLLCYAGWLIWREQRRKNADEVFRRLKGKSTRRLTVSEIDDALNASSHQLSAIDRIRIKNNLANSGILTPNDARESLGIPPLPDSHTESES